MEHTNIIEGLNIYYETFKNREQGYFVLRKTIESNLVVKAYKTYALQIWFIGKKEKKVVLNCSYVDKVVSETDEIKINNSLISKFIFLLLDYTNSAEFKELCHDTNE